MAGPWRASELIDRPADDYKKLAEMADFWDEAECGAIAAAVGSVMSGADNDAGPTLGRVLRRLSEVSATARDAAHSSHDLLEYVARTLRAHEASGFAP